MLHFGGNGKILPLSLPQADMVGGEEEERRGGQQSRLSEQKKEEEKERSVCLVVRTYTRTWLQGGVAIRVHW